MHDQQPMLRTTPLKRMLERLATIKLRAGMLRRRIARGDLLDPNEVTANLQGIERQVDEVAAVVHDLQESDSTPKS